MTKHESSDAPADAPADVAADVALTIADAARATGTDRHTIRRMLAADAFPNAFKDTQGFWRIWETDLRNAELQPDKDVIPSSFAQPVTSAPVPAASEVELLQLELVEVRHRLAHAEGLLAAERRLSDELGRSLEAERRTSATLLGQIRPEAGEPRAQERELNPAPTQARFNWQAGLRAARAREAQIRAQRARAEEQARSSESRS